jgi:tRNA-2-methylthio-N6-dimethylallyladenosine synthase
MNERDSEAIEALLVQNGYEQTDVEADADLVIVNTCTIRAKAEAKALGKLGILCARKRKQPNFMVGAVGCVVQRLEHKILKIVPKLDFAIGTRSKAFLPEIIEVIKSGGGPVIDCANEIEFNEEAWGEHKEGQLMAYVNIILGCERRCAYCIVPSVRGVEWSRSPAKVLEEVERVVGLGVKEVTLLGQSVLQYGVRNKTWDDDYVSALGYMEPFPRLMETVDVVAGLERIRFISSHPARCTDEFARAMSELPKVCEHIHLPLQSGSDEVLKRMRRGYNTQRYREAVASLRKYMPGFAITTDIIVGFPGETLEQFEESRTFMEEIGFDNAYIFKYSTRPGTPAAEWGDDVSEAEKIRRHQVLLEDQNIRGQKLNEQLIGTSVEVLVEGVSKRNKQKWSGRSRTNKIVVFDVAGDLEIGDLVKVKISSAKPQTIYGEIE